MTRDDAIALLELMKREQRKEADVPPVESERIARRYVRMMSQLCGWGQYGGGEYPRTGTGRRSC